MSKPEKLYIEGYDFFMWPYEEQTKMKHKVISSYFPLWATKLGKYKETNFFDCFGGCGAYLDESDGSIIWGSSLIVAEKATELKKKYGRKINIFVSEIEQENVDNLKTVIGFVKPEVKPKVACLSFEDTINHTGVEISLYGKNPSLFFVDPFGYSISFDDVIKPLQYQKNELIINFMFDYINRFIAKPDLEDTLNKFFGCEDWKEARNLNKQERENKLIDVYRNQLKKHAKYVFPYKISFYDRDRTYYYLFHVTNHLDGATLMKSCFAEQNYGKVGYFGSRNNIQSLFDLDEIKIPQIEKELLDRYQGCSISFRKIVEDVIDETFYLEKNIRAAIKELRKDGIVDVIPVTSKKDGVAGEDLVVFK